MENIINTHVNITTPNAQTITDKTEMKARGLNREHDGGIKPGVYKQTKQNKTEK